MQSRCEKRRFGVMRRLERLRGATEISLLHVDAAAQIERLRRWTFRCLETIEGSVRPGEIFLFEIAPCNLNQIFTDPHVLIVRREKRAGHKNNQRKKKTHQQIISKRAKSRKGNWIPWRMGGDSNPACL